MALIELKIDRKSGISIRQQLKGAIEHKIAFGALHAGSLLPSIRDLAEQVGVASTTVSKVYGELKDAGLIDTRSGSGTFVAESPLARYSHGPEINVFRQKIDDLIDHALRVALRAEDILTIINARVTYRLSGGGRQEIVMVGLFADATASYARCIEGQVGHLAVVVPTTLDVLASDKGMRARAAAADLVLTFSNLRDDIEHLMPGVSVLTLRFIPSETTRLALASLDPMARVGIVSRFADFLPTLTLGTRRFAAHVHDVSAHCLDDPDLKAALADRDVLILSTGADAATGYARADAVKLEYRHIPDPGDVNRLVIANLTHTDRPTAADRKEAS